MTNGIDIKKAVLVILLALVMAFTFTGCEKTAENTGSVANETAQTENVQAEEPVTGGGESEDDANETAQTENVQAEEPVTGGGESEGDANGKTKGRTPVTPVENGGNINKS